MIARILSVYWVIGSQFWACKSRRQSSLDCWHPETYALSTPSMNHFCLWCSEVNCWQEQIHKFKTEYLLIWRKYLSTWTSIKYFGHQVQVSTKYFWISKGQVQVSTKYSIIRIKYQVPSTSTLLDPNPDIWVVYSLCFFCCLFITVTWWYVWCFEWASGNQEEVQACLVTSWLFIISCYSLYKTTLGLLCSWFENNPHFHKYSMDFHV